MSTRHQALGSAFLREWWLCLGLFVAYEGVEGILRRIKTKDGGVSEYESWPNILGDLVAGMAGFGAIALAVRIVTPVMHPT